MVQINRWGKPHPKKFKRSDSETAAGSYMKQYKHYADFKLIFSVEVSNKSSKEITCQIQQPNK